MKYLNPIVDALRRDKQYWFDSLDDLRDHVSEEYGIVLSREEGRVVLKRLDGYLKSADVKI